MNPIRRHKAGCLLLLAGLAGFWIGVVAVAWAVTR